MMDRYKDCLIGLVANADNRLSDVEVVAVSAALSDLTALRRDLAELRAERDKLLSASNEDQHAIDLLRIECDRLAEVVANIRRDCEASIAYYSTGGQKVAKNHCLLMSAAKHILRDIDDAAAEAAREKGST